MLENVKPDSQSTRPTRPTCPGDKRSSAILLPQESRTHDNQQQIQGCIQKLTRIYDDVEDITSPVVDLSEYSNLSIKCQELRLNSNGSYANPRPLPYFFNASFPNVVNYPIDLEKEGGSYRLNYDAFDKVLKRYMGDPSSAYSSTTQLCDELDWEFCEYPRMGIRDNLAAHTNWRQSGHFREDAIFHRVFWDELFLQHDIMEEKLLRGEVLAIVAATITRLGPFFSEEHLYIPVLVFSFMGHLHGRILHTHYDGASVVIRKTKLYHFMPENARTLLNIFMQQMGKTPIGATKGMSRVGTKKTPQGSSQDFSLRQKPSNTR